MSLSLCSGAPKPRWTARPRRRRPFRLRKGTTIPLFVTITSVPPGDAPLWVREQWLGVTLHVVKKTDQGLVVVSHFAIDRLEQKSPDAANWWRKHQPDTLLPKKAFVFAAECGDLFEQDSEAFAQPRDMTLLTAHLNARLRPLDRGRYFEHPLDERLEAAGLGRVTGGGTLQEQSGEIASCDVDLQLVDRSPRTIDFLVDALEQLGAPKGSTLLMGGDAAPIAVGRAEGLAVYLNGTDLPAEVYRTSDSNAVLAELGPSLGPEGRVLSYWEGPRETALYLYGTSFDTIRARIASFLAMYPLCARCRIVQIA